MPGGALRGRGMGFSCGSGVTTSPLELDAAGWLPGSPSSRAFEWTWLQLALGRDMVELYSAYVLRWECLGSDSIQQRLPAM